jgi:adenosine kinase
MSALICGSIAFDTVMVFPGRFREHILPDRIHMLNVAFLVPSMRRNYGGCAGNIAYNLGLLGARGAPMATVGHDFEPYRRWLHACNVSLDTSACSTRNSRRRPSSRRTSTITRSRPSIRAR